MEMLGCNQLVDRLTGHFVMLVTKQITECTVAQLNLALRVFGNNGDRIGFDQGVEIRGLLAKLLLRFAALGNVLIKHQEAADVAVFEQRHAVNLDINQLAALTAALRSPMYRLFGKDFGDVALDLVPKISTGNQIARGMS